ncbi:MAG: hypothetical protein A2889_05685 [Nitrospinae bacterium RIFCSPLOWO2_01_FULL_39_10]|nr:MAG: hypothetical protein A2889_05685 [Nitrospinae bacterium RIFCSPLOWO2_01_FULL_39_10]
MNKKTGALPISEFFSITNTRKIYEKMAILYITFKSIPLHLSKIEIMPNTTITAINFQFRR